MVLRCNVQAKVIWLRGHQDTRSRQKSDTLNGRPAAGPTSANPAIATPDRRTAGSLKMARVLPRHCPPPTPFSKGPYFPPSPRSVSSLTLNLHHRQQRSFDCNNGAGTRYCLKANRVKRTFVAIATCQRRGPSTFGDAYVASKISNNSDSKLSAVPVRTLWHQHSSAYLHTVWHITLCMVLHL